METLKTLKIGIADYDGMKAPTFSIARSDDTRGDHAVAAAAATLAVPFGGAGK